MRGERWRAVLLGSVVLLRFQKREPLSITVILVSRPP
jgi:hypothetical protein